MRLTRQQLRRIIREEKLKMGLRLNESTLPDQYDNLQDAIRGIVFKVDTEKVRDMADEFEGIAEEMFPELDAEAAINRALKDEGGMVAQMRDKNPGILVRAAQMAVKDEGFATALGEAIMREFVANVRDARNR